MQRYWTSLVDGTTLLRLLGDGNGSSGTVVTPFIFLELFIIINSTCLSPFPRLSAPPHSSQWHMEVVSWTTENSIFKSADIQANVQVQPKKRTPDSYDSAVCDLQTEDIQDYKGIKYFIKQKQWFTYSTLNRRIKQFKYKGADALTKPCAVNSGLAKLSGQAIQNWNFLRLLPVLIEMTDSERTFLHTTITDILPDLPEVTKHILEETLQSLGVETRDDFRFIEEADLLSALRPVQARKVLAALKLRCQTPESSSSSGDALPGPSTSFC
ncbi:hypothetical protein cypCar_00003540 [Cyprinus carpio]|nr:hypothetical protein cypCar_00003540 [Cyprinus carpio]